MADVGTAVRVLDDRQRDHNAAQRSEHTDGAQAQDIRATCTQL